MTFLAAVAAPVAAEVTLPSVFSPHMVIQRNQPVPVWGRAKPGENVAVTLAGQVQATTADADGRWIVTLEPVAESGPHFLKVEGINTIELSDVLVGEVWLASGQSNMARPVAHSLNAQQEVAAANHPHIRMFTIAETTAETPQPDVEGSWQVCSPETAGNFSATAYFFARELHQELGVPVGLIDASWGGTSVQAWTSMERQREQACLEPLFDVWARQLGEWTPEKAERQFRRAMDIWKKHVARLRAEGATRLPTSPRRTPNPALSKHRPGNLFNGMIGPLIPYGIRGAIWYQGELNALGASVDASGAKSHTSLYNPGLYRMQLALMVADWRARWGQGEFPFLYVQLPNFGRAQVEPSETNGWVIVREQMFKALKVPGTGMAVTIDIGEADNIHPRNKQEVGQRLAYLALAKVYDRDRVACGPLYRSMRQVNGGIAITFDHSGAGLAARGRQLEGFVVAGADRKFVWAEAMVDRPDTVVVTSAEVANPVAVRYAWAQNPKGNLVNSADLPASPFRTDDWELERPD